jgi:uncharacterized protein HemX
MNPELTGFLLGLLLGAAKVMAIGTVGFGLAWWRARGRIRHLEAEQLETERLAAPDREDWRQLQEGLAQVIVQLDQITRTQAGMMKQLTERSANRPEKLPLGNPRP